MRITVMVGLVFATTVAATAVAHTGATGVVKERMDGMMAMGTALKQLTPMMRGQSDYNPAVIRASADIFIQHSGEAMTTLFPEGTAGTPSEARETIWEEWEEFAALADALKVSAQAMKLAAGNGLGGASGMRQGTMMGLGQNGMGSGTGGMSAGGASMMGGASPAPMSVEELASMPVSASFMAVTQSCSACHQKFRAESN